MSGGPCRWLLGDRHPGQQNHQRRGEHQRPGDGLPGPQAPGQDASLGISNGADNNSGEEQQIGPVQGAETAALQHGKAERSDTSGARRYPERPGRPLTGPQDSHHGRGGRQRCDDDGAVARRNCRQGKRREKRETGNRTTRDHSHLYPLPPAGDPLAGQKEGCAGQERRCYCPSGSNKQGGQLPVSYGDAGEGHREGKGGDT